MRKVILSGGIILLLGLVGYIVGMVFLAKNTREERKIDVDLLEKYIAGRGQCDLINGTILATLNFDCSRFTCDCGRACRPYKVLNLDNYKCFLLTIKYQDILYSVPIDACLSHVDLDEFSVNKSAWDSTGFLIGIILGIAGLFITLVISSLLFLKYCTK